MILVTKTSDQTRVCVCMYVCVLFLTPKGKNANHEKLPCLADEVLRIVYCMSTLSFTQTLFILVVVSRNDMMSEQYSTWYNII